MSYAAERWARSQTVGNSTAKAVLRELAFYHNGQTGLCCPSVSKIARVLEVKKADTITAAIKRLEEGGFISREFIRDPETGQILRTEYALIGFVASEWVSSKNQDTSPEDQGTSPENRGTVPQKRGRGSPEKRGEGSPEKRGEGSPENQDVTGNRNREIEQGIETHEDAASGSTPPKARAKKGEAWKKWIKVEKPAEVPDDLWKQFGEIRALKKMALTERALELLRTEGEKAHMTLLQVVETCCGNGWAGFKASWLTKAIGNAYRKPQNITQTAEYRERLQACCRGEGRTEKLADDGVTIIVD